jgi:hypothetical protein
MSDESKEPQWVKRRESCCRVCSIGRCGNICIVCKQKHPERDCVIAIGVRIPRAHCPLGWWGREPE